MKSKDATPLEAIQLRGTRQFTLTVPVNIRNEREIVRRATREIDPPVELPRKFDSIDLAILIVCLVSASAYLLLFYGLLDWIPQLFK